MQTFARILAPLITLSLVACGGGGSSAAGEWKLDGEATIAANESSKAAMMADVPEEAREMAEQMFTNMFKTMEVSLTLAEDGTVTGMATMPNPMGGEAIENKTSGTWSADGNQVTIVTKDEGSTTEDTMVATMSGDTLTADVSEGEGPALKVILSRQ
jgi:hypothetical protein